MNGILFLCTFDFLIFSSLLFTLITFAFFQFNSYFFFALVISLRHSIFEIDLLRLHMKLVVLYHQMIILRFSFVSLLKFGRFLFVI